MVPDQQALFFVLFLKINFEPGVVVHAFNPSTREAEAGGFLSSRPAWSTK
jgi:major histocompatibility complex class I